MTVSNKLQSIPLAWRWFIVHEWFMENKNNNDTVAHIISVLESIGTKESNALLDAVRSKDEKAYPSRRIWFQNIMSLEKNPLYYAIYNKDTGLIRKLAESGNVLAMACMHDDFWTEKAAALNQANALFYLTNFEDFKGLAKCAGFGHTTAMYMLSNTSSIDRHLWRAWYVLLTGTVVYDTNPVLPEHMYAVGDIMEGYDQFWDEGKRVREGFMHCINFYISIRDRVRKAALHTVLCLRRRQICRDVASLIGEMVYKNRIAWVELLNQPSKSKRIKK
jgi:hypothetical protein